MDYYASKRTAPAPNLILRDLAVLLGACLLILGLFQLLPAILPERLGIFGRPLLLDAAIMGVVFAGTSIAIVRDKLRRK